MICGRAVLAGEELAVGENLGGLGVAANLWLARLRKFSEG